MKLSENPAFQGVDQDFVSRLETILSSANYKSNVEVLGLLMAISNEANQKNIPFTPEMQLAILQYFKNQLPKNQRGQFDALVKMLSSKKGF
ncbi:hypothetical protein QTL86_10845 [Cellulosilyticum sp. ST5]|uniref:hypothetical protein n=1 Tax=Cellulosilyticum sp. ST5 TaxID=3055805 RepID=UPI0039773BB6